MDISTLPKRLVMVISVAAVIGSAFPSAALAGSADALLVATAAEPAVRDGTPDSGVGPAFKDRVAAGEVHTCLLGGDGTIRCWGSNSHGQIGNGQLGVETSRGPVKVIGISSAIAVAAGGFHTCALLADGTVRCWGSNSDGQLGRGSTSPGEAVAAAVAGLTGVTSISAGIYHTCAVLSSGGVRCWGANSDGQLGNGASLPGADSATPSAVLSVTGARSLGTGLAHSCAVLADGTVRCWGANGDGQLGSATPARTSTARAVPGLSSVTTVDGGNWHTCATTASGGVRCWGRNDVGQIGNGATLPAPDVTAPVAVSGVSGAISVSTGAVHTCALIVNGGVSCWGRDNYGELGRGSVGPSSSTAASVTSLSGAVALSLGTSHSCALITSGAIRCWGWNRPRNLPVGGTSYETPSPVTVRGRLDTPMISAGSFHSCAIVADGTARCWGTNADGQLGDGTTTPTSTPRSVSGLTGVVEVSAGGHHSCALLRDGAVRCWGSNEFGQLGIGTSGAGLKSLQPVVPLGLPKAIAISAGGDHTCAVLANLQVACWGGNAEGQIGNGTFGPVAKLPVIINLSGAVSISAGSLHTCAVLANGEARCWGANWNSQVGSLDPQTRHTAPTTVHGTNTSSIGAVTQVVEISARYASSCALFGGGEVRCWGWNGYGQLGRAGGDLPYPHHDINAATFAVGIGPSGGHGVHSCAVIANGGARCWGANDQGQLGNGSISPTESTSVGVAGLTDAAQISVGFQHTCAILAGGSAKCWGNNGGGRLGSGVAGPAPTPTAVGSFSAGSRAIAVEAGANHSCAVLARGTARCWGSNGSGRLGDGTTTNRTKPVTVTGLTNVTAISAGGAHTCALLSNGTAKCHGNNAYGQLGNASTTNRSAPVTVSGLSAAIAISAGSNHSCALLSNGTVKCWGRNTSGQLGDGTTTRRTTPVLVKASSTTTLSSVIAISAGSDHTCALLANGTARCWGAGGSGRLGNGSTLNRPYPVAVSGVTTSSSIAARLTAISAGGSHTCAKVAGGTAKCWGLNGPGRLGDGTTTNRSTPVTVSGLSGVASISAGGSHSCAQLAGGTAKCWGYGANGRLGTGSTSSRSTPGTVSGLTGASGVSAGGSHTCAMLGTGEVRCWGLNASGQLGIGTTTSSSTQKIVLGI